jgi:NAD(P)H-hydrate epimerase
MKILTAEQIRSLDAHTIEHEPIPSIQLMERAAESCVEWLWKEFGEQPYSFFCGTGNNGGDGLAMARHFSLRKYDCEVYVLGNPQKGSDDFKTNIERLEETDCRIYYLNEEHHLFTLPKDSLIVDCIFGSGLNRPVEGWRAKIIEQLNKNKHRKVAIDIPSGLFADRLETQSDCCLEADITLTFQVPKRSFLFRENESKVGRLIVRDIGLDQQFHASLQSDMIFTDLNWASSVYKDRYQFSHKGTFGHLAICGGSKGKIGAVTMAAQAALRSGVGLLTALIPEVGYSVFQQSVPPAMCLTSGGKYIVDFELDLEPTVIAIGPGLGQAEDTASGLADFLEKNKTQLVIDADGLNLLAKNQELLEKLPENSILTPHPREFDRLFGYHKTDFDRLETLRKKSQELKSVIALKGAFTRTALPDGTVFFNSTGNPGMASGGMGDSLTGIIGALLTQGYNAKEAAVLGTFMHGKAADLALEHQSQESLLATDLPDYLGRVFKLIAKGN